jgi:glycosyltransferase 2 family protein
MRQGVRRSIKLLAGLLVTAVCSWLVLRQVDVDRIRNLLLSADFSWIILGLSFLGIGYAFRIIRWWLMLRSIAPGLQITSCAGPFLSSIALNNLLPFRAGDIMRVIGFCRQLTLPASSVLGSLVLERLLDLAAILILFFAAFPSLSPDGFLSDILVTARWLAALCVGVLGLVIVMPERCAVLARRVAEIVHGHGWERVGRLAQWISDFFSSLALMRARRHILPLVCLSLGAWCMEGALFAAVAKGIHIAEPGIAPWFALSTGTLGTLLPSTPGYIGTFDYLTMVGFLAYGVPHSISAACALLIHVVLWVPQTIVGMAWLLAIKLRPTAPAMESRSSARVSA